MSELVKSTNGTEKRKSLFDKLKDIADAQVNLTSGRLILVLDCSGSMEGDKIEQLNRAVRQTIDNYATKAEMEYILFPLLMRGYGNHIQCPIGQFHDLHAGGGTPMAEALEALAKNPDGTQSILMSDGQPNSEPRVREVVEGKLKGHIVVNTIACGEDANEALLQWIAAITGGTYIKAGQPLQLAYAFKELGRKAVAALTAGRKEIAQ